MCEWIISECLFFNSVLCMWLTFLCEIKICRFFFVSIYTIEISGICYFLSEFRRFFFLNSFFQNFIRVKLRFLISKFDSERKKKRNINISRNRIWRKNNDDKEQKKLTVELHVDDDILQIKKGYFIYILPFETKYLNIFFVDTLTEDSFDSARLMFWRNLCYKKVYWFECRMWKIFRLMRLKID